MPHTRFVAPLGRAATSDAMTDAFHAPIPVPATPIPDPATQPGTTGSAFSLTLGDVHLVSSWLAPRSGSDTGTRPKDVAIGGLSLVFDQVGITLLKPGGAVGAVLPWPSLLEVTVDGQVETPEGASALMIEATTAERTHRFLVATTDPDGLRAVVEEVVTARRTQRRGRGRTWRTAALIAVAVVVAAGIALALLATVGGVKL